MGVNDDIRFLASSTGRSGLLAHLTENTNDVRSMRDELDIPRSTLQRNLNELQEQGWVTQREDGTYQATEMGALVNEDFQRLRETMEFVDGLSEMPDSIPFSAFDLDLRRLQDATFTAADPNDPYAPVNRTVELLEEVSRVRMVLPYYDPTYAEVLSKRQSTDDVDTDVVLQRNQLYSISGASHTKLSELAEADDTSIHLHCETVPYGLGILGDVVVIEGRDEDSVNGIVESTDDVVRTWAEEKFLDYRAASEPLNTRL